MSGYVYGRYNGRVVTYFASLKACGGQRTTHSTVALVRGEILPIHESFMRSGPLQFAG